MPGGGVNKSNIVNFESFDEIHGSFTKFLSAVVDLSKK